jgi:hypothetical protein
VSYPLIYANRDDEVGRFLSTGWAGMVRHQMQRITARVVRAALDVDLLVRGGLSQGRLYHRGRVVVGEAMVDAYRLERCVAACARVAVSPRIPDKEGLFIDTDGTRCLDFFTELMLTADEVHGEALAWARTKLAGADSIINVLIESNRQREAAKSIRFRDWLRTEMVKWPGSTR